MTRRREHRDSADPLSIGDSLHRVVRCLRPDTSPRSAMPSVAAIGGVFGMWEEAVGAQVAAHVQPVKLTGGVLVVEVDDPAWATQLKFLEATLRQRLAEVAGATVDSLEVRVARRR